MDLIYIVITLILISLLSILFNKKKHPPSPLALPIVGHLHLLSTKEPLHHTVNRMHDQLGPILSLRFGIRNVLVVAKSTLAKECLLSNGTTFANRPRFPSFKDLTFGFTILGTANYGPHWRNLRKLASSELLAPHSLLSTVDIRASEQRSLIQTLFQNSSPNGGMTKVELKSKLFALTLNNIMRMLAGKTFSTKKSSSELNHEEETFREWVDDVFSILGGRTNIADFLPFLRWMDLNGFKSKAAYLSQYRDEFFQKIIDDVRYGKNDEERKTMVATLLSLQKSDPKYYTDEIIKGFGITVLAAGTDTTSNTLEWALALMLNNPETLKKLQSEIDLIIGNNRLVSESDVQNLPYLQSVITETLRLKPAGPMMVPHEASSDCTVGGYRIKKGTMLLVNAYRIHRDPETWADPERFEPERFMEKGLHDVGKMLIFGMGRMRCPGEALAKRMVGSVLGSMVQCFDWERVGGEMIGMEESVAITMGKEVALEALCRPRGHMMSVLEGLRV